MYEWSSVVEQSHLAVWFPCWYRESSREPPGPRHTSPPQGISAYFSCQSPSDWQDPAMSVPYTEERWAIFRTFVNSFCITTEVSNTIVLTDPSVCSTPLRKMYLLRDTVSEVLLFKMGQLQQRRFGLLKSLNHHLRQLHAVLYRCQPGSPKP